MWIAGAAGLFAAMYMEEYVGQVLWVDSLLRALACGIAGDAPVPLRSQALRNSGRVPLSLQKNAKGGEQGAQLACGSNKCPLPSNAFSCEPRGSQLPPSRRPAPGGIPSLLSSYQTIQIHSYQNHCASSRFCGFIPQNTTFMMTTIRKTTAIDAQNPMLSPSQSHVPNSVIQISSHFILFHLLK